MYDKVPNLPNYENFMKITNKSTVFIFAFMNFLMKMNRRKDAMSRMVSIFDNSLKFIVDKSKI